jgi:Ni,Fe-hydrogenase I cytochrome b subunit
MLWFFAVMVLLHLYFVIYTVIVSRTTEIDTMFSGMKFVFESELAKEKEDKA